MGLCTPGAELKALWLPLKERAGPWAEGESSGLGLPTPQRVSVGGTNGGERLMESW